MHKILFTRVNTYVTLYGDWTLQQDAW